MKRKLFKYFGRFILLIVSLIIILGITYLINPEYVQNKAIDVFMPTVTINDDYKNKIVVENPEVYVLMQIACSLTETFQKDNNLVNKKKAYYKDFEAHFSLYKNHELVVKLNDFLKKNPYGMDQHAIRLLSLNYDINSDGKLIDNKTIHVNSILSTLFKSKAFLISENIDLIENFANKSDFKTYYHNHKEHYNKLVYNYNQFCDFQNMKNWLEKKFTNQYQSYRIIFSPLTGGFHNTMSFKSHDKSMEQTFMFVSAPSKDIENLSEKEFEIAASKMARIVFTEIDHNYVNPLTDKYREKLESSMISYKDWNNQKGNMYNSKYSTFNEYMTWGVFNLYAYDTYSTENIDTIIKIQTDFINDKRKFHRFREFNTELFKQYKENSKSKIEKLYKPMLNWIEEKSL